MKISYISKILSIALILSFVLPSSLFAESMKGTVDKKLVENWNRRAANWPTLKTPSEMEREIKKMNLNYNPHFESQDQKFLQSALSQVSDFPILKIKGDSYECFQKKSGALLFTAKVLGGNKYTFNGKAFEYDSKSTLESNVSRIKDLLGTEKVSFLDQAFLPQANAITNGWIVGIAALAGLFMYSTWNSGGENVSGTFDGIKKTVMSPFNPNEDQNEGKAGHK